MEVIFLQYTCLDVRFIALTLLEMANKSIFYSLTFSIFIISLTFLKMERRHFVNANG
jgi:hypothetical protein